MSTQPSDLAINAHYAWSSAIGGPGLEVRRFRRRFTLAAVPSPALVHVTAESRYVLYVNGTRVGRGPLKGTLDAYHYETFDVAPLLVAGENVIAAEARWFGIDRPQSEIHSYRAGFLLQGPPELGINTPSEWLVLDDGAVTSDRTSWFSNSQGFLTHTERVDASKLPQGWTALDYDDTTWKPASDAGSAWSSNAWGVARSPILHPRPIAQLAEEPRSFVAAWVGKGTRQRREWPGNGWSLDAGAGGEIVLDVGELTTGYPRFHFRGGAGRTVEIIYAESALFRPAADAGQREVIPAPDGPWTKRVRDDIANGSVAGYRDTIVLDGGEVEYEPFHWRTFWFIGLRIGPGEQRVNLTAADFRYTTYPVELAARFGCNRPEYAEIWEMCWRTLRLCSHETFEDCPYYEQLHYLGDARLEALTHMYLTGDTNYVRRSIAIYRNSSRWDGLVESRPPSADPQIIPYFALLWVLMLEDFWDFAGETEREFLRTCLHAMDGTLVYFRNRLRDDGLVGHVDPWNMVDNGPGWVRGEPPALVAGESSYLTMLFILAARTGARLHREVGHPADAARWEALVGELTPKMRDAAWDEGEGLFLEAPGRPDYRKSRHTQIMAILSGVAAPEQIDRIRPRLSGDEALISTKLMQSFYLARALEATGAYGELHERVLAPWHEMRALHLSTCAEYLPGRSDCHAWSSWPALEFVRSVLGVRPGRPGFTEVVVAPQTDGLTHANGSVPTPAGPVEVSWTREGTLVRVEAKAPAGVPLTVVIGGERFESAAGGALSAAGTV